jgi:hypothetical protein
VPAKLKHLTLGENVFNTRASKACNPRLTRNVKGSMAAIGQVADSLETLTHYDPSWKLDPESHKTRRTNPPGEGMRHYHALKYIQCETSSFIHQAIIMNHGVAPPNLETLRLARHYKESDDFFDRLPEVETYLALPSLTTLELMQASTPRKESANENYICDTERVNNRHAYAFKLHKAGINFKVLIQMHEGGIIPPYLHGELRPITECLYDAQEIGFKQTYTEREIQTLMALAPESGGFDFQGYKHKPFDPNAPETAYFSPVHLSRLKQDNRSILTKLKEPFLHRGRMLNAGEFLADPFAVELGMMSDDDFDDIMDEDDLDIVFHEHDGELYIEVYESETDSEDEDDEEDDEDEDEETGDVDMNDDLD